MPRHCLVALSRRVVSSRCLVALSKSVESKWESGAKPLSHFLLLLSPPKQTRLARQRSQTMVVAADKSSPIGIALDAQHAYSNSWVFWADMTAFTSFAWPKNNI